MADKTINTLDTELVTVGANDLIGVWDVAAAQYKKAKRSNVVGATITGGGTIALGGYTLTVPASGTPALLGTQNTFTAAQIIPQIRSAAAVALTDDTATSINLAGAASGIIIFMASLSGVASGMVMFRVGSSLQCTILAQASGSVLAATTNTALTGTTGTDGKLTFSAHTDNKLYIENRTGSAFSGLWLIIGVA